MTETSPIGTLRRAAGQLGRDERRRAGRFHRRQGRVPFGVELRIVDEDGNVLPRDGVARAASDPRAVGRPALFQGRRGRDRRRQLVRHRRRRRAPSRRDDADHRPLEGRDQVGRRVDQLDRARECRGRLPRRRRGGGDRHRPSQVGRAAAAGGRSRRRAATSAPNRSAIISAARSPNGGCPTRSNSSTSFPTPPPANCRKRTLREQFSDYRFADAEAMVGRD